MPTTSRAISGRLGRAFSFSEDSEGALPDSDRAWSRGLIVARQADESFRCTRSRDWVHLAGRPVSGDSGNCGITACGARCDVDPSASLAHPVIVRRNAIMMNRPRPSAPSANEAEPPAFDLRGPRPCAVAADSHGREPWAALFAPWPLRAGTAWSSELPAGPGYSIIGGRWIRQGPVRDLYNNPRHLPSDGTLCGSRIRRAPTPWWANRGGGAG